MTTTDQLAAALRALLERPDSEREQARAALERYDQEQARRGRYRTITGRENEQ